MQSLECVELLLYVLLPKMSVPDIKNLGLQNEWEGRGSLGVCDFTTITKSYICVFVPHKRLLRNSMPCQLKTLLHQHWSQMKAMVQLFKGK